MAEGRRKVLFVSFDVIPEPTGTSARATELLRGLTPLYQVDALTAKTPDHSHIERYYGARLLRVPVGSGDLPARAQSFERAVRRQLESDEYELVHVTDPYGGYPICELRGQYGYKVVYECHGFPSVELRYTHPHLDSDRRFFAKLRRQEIFCLMNGDAVIVPSQVTLGYVKALGVMGEKVRVVPGLVDLPPFSDLPAPSVDAQLRLVYLGGDATWQGLPTLLFALKTAGEEADLLLTVVGQKSAERRRLEQQARSMKLLDGGGRARVEFKDPVPHEDVPAIVASADVGVAPLETGPRNLETGASPAKIAEYCAAGRAVIASDLPIVREMIEAGVQGLLVPPGDAAALARAIVTLAKDPSLRAAMGARGRERARERFDADRARRTLVAIYRDLLEPSVVVSPEAFAPKAAEAEETGDMLTSTVELPIDGGPPPGTSPGVRARSPEEQTDSAKTAIVMSDEEAEAAFATGATPSAPAPAPPEGASDSETQPRAALPSAPPATPEAGPDAPTPTPSAPTPVGPAHDAATPLEQLAAAPPLPEETRPRVLVTRAAVDAEQGTDPEKRAPPDAGSGPLPPAPELPMPIEPAAAAAPTAGTGGWFDQLVYGSGPKSLPEVEPPLPPPANRRRAPWDDPSQVVVGRLLTPAPVPEEALPVYKPAKPASATAKVPGAPPIIPPAAPPAALAAPPVPPNKRAPVIIPPKSEAKGKGKEAKKEHKPPPLPREKKGGSKASRSRDRKHGDEDSSPDGRR